MQGHKEKCVEIYCEFAEKSISFLALVGTPCSDDYSLPPEDCKSEGELSDVLVQIVLKCSYVARIGRLALFWPIHYSRDCTQFCHVGDSIDRCHWALFQDASFARDLNDSKATPCEMFFIFGTNTFVLYPGCARSKLQCLTEAQSLQLFRSMLG